MRTMILVALSLIACSTKNAGPKPHDPVKGPAMWRVHVDELSIQALDNSDKPTGAVTTISERDKAQVSCRLEADPGNAAVATWITASVDETGHTRMTHDRDSAVPQDVNGCAHQAVANVKLTGTPGEYKVSMKVWFSDPQPQ